jgi:hypothetical protein
VILAHSRSAAGGFKGNTFQVKIYGNYTLQMVGSGSASPSVP